MPLRADYDDYFNIMRTVEQCVYAVLFTPNGGTGDKADHHGSGTDKPGGTAGSEDRGSDHGASEAGVRQGTGDEAITWVAVIATQFPVVLAFSKLPTLEEFKDRIPKHELTILPDDFEKNYFDPMLKSLRRMKITRIDDLPYVQTIFEQTRVCFSIRGFQGVHR